MCKRAASAILVRSMSANEEMTDCEGLAEEEAEETLEEDTAPRAKKSKKSSGSGGGGGGVKAALAELLKQKKAAAKNEDYLEANRLKKEIDELQAKSVADKAKPNEKPSPKGAKRALSPPPAKAKKGKEPEEPKKPAVEELSTDPFFGDARPELLMPDCQTAAEREAWRAVSHGNIDFLKDKLQGEVPLFTQRDVASKQTALHLAILKGDVKAMALLARVLQTMGGQVLSQKARAASMATHSTGHMNIETLGFETGKIGAARGGKELNNALMDSTDPPEKLELTISRAPLTVDQVNLLTNLDVIQYRAVMRRGKVIIRNRGRDSGIAAEAMNLIEPAMRYGSLAVVRAVLTRLGTSVCSPAHLGACGAEAMPEKLQSRSVTAKLRFGGMLTPAHIAAINPDVTVLQSLLKLEPSVLTMTSDSGVYPVHYAAACTAPGPLRLLLSDYGADRRSNGSDKRTPLHYAAAAGRPENIKVLMGGSGTGIGRSLLFTKEIKVVLARQTPNVKIGAEGTSLLSRLLVDMMYRINAEVKKEVEEGQKLGLKLMHMATKEVLKGSLAARIAERAGQLAVGKVGLPSAPSALARSMSLVSGDELTRLFHAVDINHDGTLQKNEIEEVFAKAGVKLAKKAFEKVVKDMDTDGNGEVSLDEFTCWMEAGSGHAKTLRRHLVASTGAMGPAEMEEAEAAEEEELLKGIANLAFDAAPLLQLLGFLGAEDHLRFEQYCWYASAILECTCTKVLEVSVNAARSQKKTTVLAGHILDSIKVNTDLQGLYQTDSVVMNSLLLEVKDKESQTALHLAADGGHTECVEVLVACGADVDTLGPERKSPLSLASERGHLGCVKALLHAGAKLESADKRHRTPLLLAVRAGQTVIASLLLNKLANPNAADDSGNTIVHYAAAFGWIHCVDMLHKAGATLSSPNAMKLVPITASLQKGHKTVFRKLLQLGIDVNFRDAHGSTLLLGCLGSVSRLVHSEIDFMLSKGADPTLASSSKDTALHAVARAQTAGASAFVAHPFEAERLRICAGYMRRPEPKSNEELQLGDEVSESEGEAPVAKRARKLPSEPLPEPVHRRGFHQLTNEEREAVFRIGWQQNQWQAGHNALQPWSALDGTKRAAAALLGFDESSWVFVPVRVVMGQRDCSGELPVQEGIALSADDHGMITVCLKSQFNKETGQPCQASTTMQYHTSMVLLPTEDVERVWAVMPHVTVAIARLLLDKGAVVDARDEKGFTPLMLALQAGHFDLAIELLDRGADPNAQEVLPPPPEGKEDVPRPRPRGPLDFCCAAPAGSMQHGLYTRTAIIRQLLSKGAEAKLPNTELDYSPVLRLLASSELTTAKLLMAAGADLREGADGGNALHVLLGRVCAHAASLAHNAKFIADFRSDVLVDLVMVLLGSAEWGELLMSSYTRSPPHVTPLHSLVQGYKGASSGAGAKRQVVAKLMLHLLQAIPTTVDFSKWSRPAEQKPNFAPPPMAESPLGLLCSQEPPAEAHATVVEAIEFLCSKGITANAVEGSPAALHTVAENCTGFLSKSSLAKVLLPLTDLAAPMRNGQTLLTFLLEKIAQQPGSRSLETVSTVSLLLQAKCNPNARKERPINYKREHAGLMWAAPLHYAAWARDEALLALLLDAQADPNLADNPETCRSPLHYAVCAAPVGADANFDVEEALLRAKADPSQADSLGLSVLHYAFVKSQRNGQHFDGKWVSFLPSPTDPMKLSDKVQWTPAAWNIIDNRIDPIETISSLCVVPGVDVNAKDNAGMSVLHLAAVCGSSIAALKLINAGARTEEVFADSTVLGLAMQRWPDMAVLLMQKSASTLAKSRVIGSNGSPAGDLESVFSIAIRRASRASTYLGAAICSMDCGFPRAQALDDTICSKEFIMLLTLIPKVGDDVLRTQRFEGGQNLLHRLAGTPGGTGGVDGTHGPQGNGGLTPQAVGFNTGFGFGGGQPLFMLGQPAFAFGMQMQEVQPQPSPAPVAEDMPPLCRAAVKLLERGVTIMVDDKKQTPLHLAANHKQGALLRLLLAKGGISKETVATADADGYTALGFALKHGDMKMAKALIQHGASARSALVPSVVPSKHRLPALSWMISSGASPRGDELAWPQVLFNAEAPDILQLDTEKCSCLRHAVGATRYARAYIRLIFRWAAAAGGDAARVLLTGAAADGLTPLFVAVDRGDVAVVNELLSAAAKISDGLLSEVLAAHAPDGTTPLMRAVDCPDGVGMVCLLLRWLDDRSAATLLAATDRAGRTVLARAVLRNNEPIVRALLCGFPLPPAPTQTSCPSGCMAGDVAAAVAVYSCCKGGAPVYTLSWKSALAPAVFGRPGKVCQNDGWHSADLHEAPNESSGSVSIANGSHVQVVAAEVGWVQVNIAGRVGYLRDVDFTIEHAHTPSLPHSEPLSFPVTLTIPPGTGPGISFSVTWSASTGGPGLPGRAPCFAGASSTTRSPPILLRSQDVEGCSALHLCIAPLPFGSYENVDMLAALLKGGVPADARRSDGQSACDLARRQRSGRMLKCLQDGGAAGRDIAVDVSPSGAEAPWPASTNAEADAVAALAAADVQLKKGAEPEPPVERSFQRPSSVSRVEVARGKDAKPLDLVMTKVDLKRGPSPQNVFYRMQVVHESNQDNYFLFTQWGCIGSQGQFQTSPFQSLEKAAAEFCKIFKSKAGNDWYERDAFEKKLQKYQLHELKYPTACVKDALDMRSWKLLSASVTPVPFRRLLNAGSSQQLLQHALEATKAEQPLGSLKTQSLAEARTLLERIKAALQRKAEWDREPQVDSAHMDRLQVIMDDLATTSSRLYEIMPTKNFSFQRVKPIADIRLYKQWCQRLEMTDDLTCAARLLLGAQAKIGEMSPVDYLYSAMGVRIVPLAHDSEELHLLERYINRSSPDHCKLFSGEGASPLPQRKKPTTQAELEAQLPLWQVLQDAPCFKGSTCLPKDHTGRAAVAGSCFKEFEVENGAICIRKATKDHHAMWVRPIDAGGAEMMVRLSERERHSHIAAIYRVDRRGEESRAGGDSAQLLFHGSGMANLLSILSNGLRVKPPGAAQAGSAFGDGIYFANTFNKSQGYSPGTEAGVCFMLLCEVALGRQLVSHQFGFQQTVTDARIQVAKKQLGLPKDAKLEDFPELKARHNQIQEEANAMGVDDVVGTECDTFHFQSGAAPDPLGAVVHPDGYLVPCGQIVSREGQPMDCSSGRDELIVYDTQRVRLRYVIEMRAPIEAFVDCPKPGDLEAEAPAAPGGHGGDSGDTQMGDGAGMDVDEEDSSDGSASS